MDIGMVRIAPFRVAATCRLVVASKPTADMAELGLLCNGKRGGVCRIGEAKVLVVGRACNEHVQHRPIRGVGGRIGRHAANPPGILLHGVRFGEKGERNA